MSDASEVPELNALDEGVDPFLDVMDDTFETVQRAYESRGWGDGLPMVPPTKERVEAMLGSLGDLDPDAVVATLPPRFGEATRRIIAINAVLAGCRPSHLPVLVSAVRALAAPELNLRGSTRRRTRLLRC